MYAVAEKESNAELSELKDFTADQFDNFDLVFVGAPCHDSDIAKPIKQLLENIPENTQFKLACFVTHSCSPPEKSDYMAGLFETWVGKCSKTLDEITSSKGINYVGYFRCMGAPSPAIENFIHTSIITDEKEFKEYVEDARNHPDELDIKNAQKFALKIIKGKLT